MAKWVNGILGALLGKIGTIVGSSWKNIYYVKGIPKKSNKKTQAQVDVRYKFKMVNSLLKQVNDLINLGFKSVVGQTPINAAVSYALENAVIGVSPDFTVDFTRLRFSQGPLKEAISPLAAASAPLKVVFTWKNYGTNVPGKSKPTDVVNLLVYNVTKGLFLEGYGAGVRSAETANLVVPPGFADDELCCYISFASTDGKAVSNSVYAGTITVV